MFEGVSERFDAFLEVSLVLGGIRGLQGISGDFSSNSLKKVYLGLRGVF